ncbi:MAG: hypothetical protein L3J34_00895 [Flavobacteriaceae bacterium]|nr:hypothetical protein [Flavobacteriaceae bacterium]
MNANKLSLFKSLGPGLLFASAAIGVSHLVQSKRAMAKSTELLLNQKSKSYYVIWISILSLGTIVILTFFNTSMITFVKIATILSFLTAPFYAISNFILISGKHTLKKHHPSKPLKTISFLGIIFLIGFSIWYLITLLLVV